MTNKLNIVETTSQASQVNDRPNRRKEAEARFDRLWLVNSKQFDPNRNAMEKERLARTLQLIQANLDLKGKKVADLGCGAGILAEALQKAGASVEAVDIAENALKQMPEGIKRCHDYVPRTKLPDGAYDLVLCTELIGYLAKEEHRLLFSELARLVKQEGHIVVSSAMDINTLDPVQQFADLAETELKLEKWRFSHHLFWIRLKDFFLAPARFYRAWRDPEYRHRALAARHNWGRRWFQINSSPVLALVWAVVQIPCAPIVALLRTNRSLLIGLEKVCRLFWGDSGISHALFLGSRKPLYIPPPPEAPVEQKHKKQLWE